MINILNILGFIILVFIVKSFFKKLDNNNTKNNIKRYNNQNKYNCNEENNLQHQQFMDEMNRQQDEINRQQQEEFMNESMKSVTPWEHGGYDMEQGNSFNDFNNNMF